MSEANENTSVEVVVDKKEIRRKQLREAQKRFYENHKEVCFERVKSAKKAYYERNKEKFINRAKEYYQKRKAEKLAQATATPEIPVA